MAAAARIDYKEGMAFDVNLLGHVFAIDADPASGGTNYGPKPKALLLSALAGCSGMDVVAILKKMQMPFETFAVEADGELAEEHPKVYKTIHIKYILTGSGLDRNKIEKAVNLSLDKYCGVAAMLKKTAVIDFEIVENPS